MRIKKKFGDKITVEWMDAYTEDGWKSFEELSKIDEIASFCNTNGWFISMDKYFLVICHTIGKTNKQNMMGKLVIPRSWVRKVE